jgi:hypothetical protein
MTRNLAPQLAFYFRPGDFMALADGGSLFLPAAIGRLMHGWGVVPIDAPMTKIVAN